MSEAGGINIRHQATISFAGNIVDAAVSFGGLVAITYVLGPADLGRYYFLLTVITVGLFPVRGMGQAVLKRGSEYRTDPPVFLGTGLSMALVYTALALLSAGLVSVSGLYTLPFDLPVLVAGGAVFVAQAVLTVQVDAYRSYGETGYATLVQNAFGVSQTALHLTALWLGYRILGLLAGTVVALFLTIVVHLVFSRLTVARPDWDVGVSLLRFGRWTILSDGISTLFTRLPILVLGGLGLNTLTGYYTAAERLLMLVGQLVRSLTPPLMAKVSFTATASGTDSMLGEFRQVHRHVTALPVAFAFGGAALSDTLMLTFFDISAPEAAAALIGLGVYQVIFAMSSIEFAFFDGLNLPDYGTKTGAVTLAVEGVGILVLLPVYGLIGVVAAVVIGRFAALVIGQVILYRRFGQRFFPGGLLTQTASGAVMFAGVELTADVVGLASVVHVFAVVGVGAVIYGTVLMAIDRPARSVARSALSEIRALFRGMTAGETR